MTGQLMERSVIDVDEFLAVAGYANDDVWVDSHQSWKKYAPRVRGESG